MAQESAANLPEFSIEEVAKHADENSSWIVIDGYVYDVSNFMNIHPGSRVPLLQHAGTDCTEIFYGLHKRRDLKKWHFKLVIGVVPQLLIGNDGTQPTMPFSEPVSLNETPQHSQFRKAVRDIVERELLPMVEADIQEPVTLENLQRIGKTGLLAALMGPGRHLTMVPQLPGNISPREFDHMHERICEEEIGRIGSLAVKDAVFGGLIVGLPLVLQFGSAEMVDRVAPDVLIGKKQMCLAITEPYAGSDVANLQTQASLSRDGAYFIVRGNKKWITQGLNADYFVTAVRTGGKGRQGISVLLIERDDNMETKLIHTAYSPTAATAYVVFDGVHVPISNLVGKVNEGFKVVVSNFNHERFAMLCFHHRFARLCVEDAFKWACQRKIFNKTLIDQPVIQDKLANLIAQIESVQAWIDQVTFKLNSGETYDSLAGTIALLKLQQTRVAQFVSDQTVQIMGGRGITKQGLGGNIERFLRSYKYGAVTGGSEEIMASLGIRQALKKVPSGSKASRL